MATQSNILPLGILVLVSLLALTKPALADDQVKRSDFPADFYFGTATSSYQVEGMANKSGRGPNLWDTFTHDYPERIRDGSNGDRAVDFYHQYKEDLKRMKDMGFTAFRFSISWSRILPFGDIRSGINEDGVKFYSDLIDEAHNNGLEPFVTLFHWSTPQALEDRYGGFLSRNITVDFRNFVDVCFERYGDRVRYWITLNEPWAYSAWGYGRGVFAPGRCSSWVNRECRGGDSATEPYIVAHNLLLAHAEAATQKGKIGITLVSYWMEPYSNSSIDQDAAKRALDFMFGWFMDPITYGRYPRTMRDLVQSRLPYFSETDSEMLKGSIDFLGLNYYSARYVKNVDSVDPNHISYTDDARVNLTVVNSEGQSIGPVAGIDWLRVVPYGIRFLLNYTKDTYRPPEIYITENGVCQDDTFITIDLIHDRVRIDYYKLHIGNVSIAMKNYSVPVKGYFAWSFMDNFEWSSGYTKRFGLYYVHYNESLTRQPKDSVFWFRQFLVPNINKPLKDENKIKQPLDFKKWTI
ncbi:hypothetical protein Tsubulata_038394 [Turnera subulata]|uniref:Beta-glucosidase n=1 Tax=Turnera subulata TaxID=218843 RepID=A0A9Q0J5V4_9ROSI|nr:hypothetical protein Tsubulata_038394 [Turnera subulata]